MVPSATGAGLRPPQVLLRIVDELRAASGRTEVVGMTAIVRAVLGRVRIDRHAADGIDRAVRAC